MSAINSFPPSALDNHLLSINIDSLRLFSSVIYRELWIVYSFFFLASFTQYIACGLHSVIVLCLWPPSLLLTSFPTYWCTTCCWALELLPCLLVSSIVLQRTVIYKSLMNICCYVFLGKYLVVRLLHYIPNLYLTLWETVNLLHNDTVLTKIYESFYSCTSLPMLGIASLLWPSQLLHSCCAHWCLHFPDDTVSLCKLVGHLYVFL